MDCDPIKRAIQMKKVAGFHSFFRPGVASCLRRRNPGVIDFQNDGESMAGR